MNNKKRDLISQIKKGPGFKKISEEVDALVRLAIEINEQRTAKSWTQQKLAQKAGTSQKMISKIENGEVDVGFDLLQRLARSLDVELRLGRAALVKIKDVAVINQEDESLIKASVSLDWDTFQSAFRSGCQSVELKPTEFQQKQLCPTVE